VKNCARGLDLEREKKKKKKKARQKKKARLVGMITYLEREKTSLEGRNLACRLRAGERKKKKITKNRGDPRKRTSEGGHLLQHKLEGRGKSLKPKRSLSSPTRRGGKKVSVSKEGQGGKGTGRGPV